MKDREFLIWLHGRLECVHGENANFDYMHKLRAIIKSTDPEKRTPNIGAGSSIEELLKELK